MSNTIIQFTTYPLKNAFHGGQRRSLAMRAAYIAAGFKVISCAVYNSAPYSSRDAGAYDIGSNEATQKKINEEPLFEDIILGFAAYDDAEIRKHIKSLITRFKPKFIVVEQPYLYLGVSKIINELSLDVGIINSSQNIEHGMKRDIYDRGVESTKRANEMVSIVRDLEREIAKKSLLTIAVSDADAKNHEKMGAKHVLVIPNGINQYVANQDKVKKWSEYFTLRGVDKLILFTGSAHQPNVDGFLDLIGTRPGFLPINSRILIVGDVGSGIEKALYEVDSQYASTFWRRVQKMGRLSDEDLTAIIDIVDIFILPISEGGGSNLKTAEALISGKKVVATQHAMRGYEEYQDDELVYIANKKEEFTKILSSIVMGEEPKIQKGSVKQKDAVLWSKRVEPLVRYMEKMNA